MEQPPALLQELPLKEDRAREPRPRRAAAAAQARRQIRTTSQGPSAPDTKKRQKRFVSIIGILIY